MRCTLCSAWHLDMRVRAGDRSMRWVRLYLAPNTHACVWHTYRHLFGADIVHRCGWSPTYLSRVRPCMRTSSDPCLLRQCPPAVHVVHVCQSPVVPLVSTGLAPVMPCPWPPHPFLHMYEFVCEGSNIVVPFVARRAVFYSSKCAKRTWIPFSAVSPRKRHCSTLYYRGQVRNRRLYSMFCRFKWPKTRRVSCTPALLSSWRLHLPASIYRCTCTHARLACTFDGGRTVEE
jgi:hypothetical protein